MYPNPHTRTKPRLIKDDPWKIIDSVDSVLMQKAMCFIVVVNRENKYKSSETRGNTESAFQKSDQTYRPQDLLCMTPG